MVFVASLKQHIHHICQPRGYNKEDRLYYTIVNAFISYCLHAANTCTGLFLEFNAYKLFLCRRRDNVPPPPSPFYVPGMGHILCSMIIGRIQMGPLYNSFVRFAFYHLLHWGPMTHMRRCPIPSQEHLSGEWQDSFLDFNRAASYNKGWILETAVLAHWSLSSVLGPLVFIENLMLQCLQIWIHRVILWPTISQ